MLPSWEDENEEDLSLKFARGKENNNNPLQYGGLQRAQSTSNRSHDRGKSSRPSIGNYLQNHNIGIDKKTSNQNNGNFARDPMPATHPTHDNEYSEQKVDYSGYTEQNNTNTGYYHTKSNRYNDRESVFDEFKYKELCLNAAGRTKMIITYLTKIKDHIIKEANLDWEVIFHNKLYILIIFTCLINYIFYILVCLHIYYLTYITNLYYFLLLLYI